jgi:hypothetical protein
MGKRIYVRSAGTWVDVTTPSGSDADITAVVAGTGLTGGASSGSATLNVDTATIATRTYVEEIATGLNWHGAVSAATTAALPNSPTYTAGSADASSGYGVGAKLTATTYGVLTVDTFDLDVVAMRVLVKNQANQIHNGIYRVTTVGGASTYWEITRAADSDNHIAGQVGSGDSVYCLGGSENAGQGFVLSSTGAINEYVHIIGTDDLSWSQFTGISNMVSGNGLSKSGNTLNVGAGTAITVNADTIEVQLTDSTSSTSITTAATPASVKVAYDAAVSAQTTANSGVSDAAAAQSTANAAIPKSLVTAKGNIVAATGSGVPSALAAGSNNQILIANSAQATGLEWITAPYAPSANPAITGKIVIDNNAGSPVSLGSLNTQTAIQAVSADATHTSIVVDAHGTGVHGSYIARATRGTAGSPTAVQSGDTVGSVIFTGYGSTGFVGGEPVAIRGLATENWTDSVNGSKVEIIVTAPGGTTASTAITATSSALELPTGSAFKIAGNTVLSASTLGSGVTASSLTSVGTIATGTWNGTAVGIAHGGTGATTAADAANAILPSQVGQSGKVLSTDGSALSWYSIDLSNLTIDGGSA